MIKKNRLFGFTLIEMMVGISVGLFVVGGALTFYAASVRSSSDTIKSARLNQDLNAVMQLVVNEVRRSGYGTDWNTDPVSTAIAECILYSYLDDTTGGTNADSFRGFRRVVIGGVGSMTMKSLPSAATITCSAVTTELTDNAVIDITDFSITDASHCTGTTDGLCGDISGKWNFEAVMNADDELVRTLLFDITLSGRLVSDSSVAKTLTQSVRVVNNSCFSYQTSSSIGVCN